MMEAQEFPVHVLRIAAGFGYILSTVCLLIQWYVLAAFMFIVASFNIWYSFTAPHREVVNG